MPQVTRPALAGLVTCGGGWLCGWPRADLLPAGSWRRWLSSVLGRWGHQAALEGIADPALEVLG